MKKVIIISHSADITSQLLLQRLKEIGSPCELIDISLFPKESFGTIDYTSGIDFVFKQNSKSFDSGDVKSVWWRRPMGKIKEKLQDSISKYIQIESDMFVRSLFYMLPKYVKWVSDPDNTRVSNSKPLQLKIAKEVGFNIPKTIISNNPTSVRRFVHQNHDIKLIMKPVGTSFYRATEEDGGNRAIYTRITSHDKILENINRIHNCPVIFQEAICEKVDLRATVIGDCVFTVSITHERDLGAGEDNLDWRNHKLERIYNPYDLPKNMQLKCIAIVKQLGLQFGAIDLCVSNLGKYYFFEINPQGQWIPTEIVAGLPVSKTLAKFLSE